MDCGGDGDAVECDGGCWMLQRIVMKRGFGFGSMELLGDNDAC